MLTGSVISRPLTRDELTALFDRIAVGEVWGVGRKIDARLEAMGIRTVRQLRDADPETIRSRFSVVLERTVRELRGISCIDLEEVVPDRQQIMVSRSFGHLVTELDELEEAVASYIARAAEKLRSQDSLAGAVQVYVRTNIFKPEVPQYQRGVTLPLPEATSDTRILAGWAGRILRRIYRPGFGYHKAGVMLLDLRPAGNRQFSLLDGQGGAGDATVGPADGGSGRDQPALWPGFPAPCGRGGRSGVADAAGESVAGLHDGLVRPGGGEGGLTSLIRNRRDSPDLQASPFLPDFLTEPPHLLVATMPNWPTLFDPP